MKNPVSVHKGNPFYITTPIYYLNGPPHLGHAYTTIVADFMARFAQLENRPTFFLTGTDEHGQKIAEAATMASKTPQTLVDESSQLFQQMTRQVGAAPHDFIRTTEKRHITGATALWKTLDTKGYIYQGTYKGWYAVRDEAFYKESDIVDGKAPTGAPVTWMEEPCYFLRLSSLQDRLLDFYARNPHFVTPTERFSEAKRWVENGLQDLAISRSTCSWGIPVPGAAGHTMYVWIDALSNYLNALGYPEKTARFQQFWPSAHHVLGKDILRFHAIYWPAMLLAADITPPKKLYVHGWWTVEGQKMSKSLGNVLAPETLINTYGIDVVRYFVLRHIPFGGDGDWSEQAILARLHADLANDLGNLFQRVLTFIQKQGGLQPEKPTALPAMFRTYTAWRDTLHKKLAYFVDNGQPHQYLQHMWVGIQEGNRLMDTLAPWKLAKSDVQTDKKLLDEGLAGLFDLLVHVAFYLQPVMPNKAMAMLQQLGYLSDSNQTLCPLKIEDLYKQQKTRKHLPRPEPLFAKPNKRS